LQLSQEITLKAKSSMLISTAMARLISSFKVSTITFGSRSLLELALHLPHYGWSMADRFWKAMHRRQISKAMVRLILSFKASIMISGSRSLLELALHLPHYGWSMADRL